MIIVGIDPGLNGAVAVLGDGVPRVMDLPVVERKTGRKTRKGNAQIKRSLDAEALASLLGLDALSGYCGPGDAIAIVEQATAAPRMGPSSAFNYGVGFGLIRGILAHLRVPTTFVRAGQWKKALGLAKPGSRELGRNEEADKDAALELARAMFPSLAAQLNLAKHDGRAEALLLAEYGRRTLPTPIFPKEF